MSYSKRLQILMCLLGLPGMLSCTQKTSQPGPSSAFDPRHTAQLLIAKNDPTSGDHWSARLARAPSQSDSQWQIKGSDSGELVDQQANTTLINHLLDALGEMKVVKGLADSGNAGALFNWGLEPAQFDFTFEGGNEIRVGQPTPDGYFYAFTNGKPVVASGIIPSLLEHLTRFQDLRQNNLAMTELDDIDEVFLKRTRAERNPSIEEGFKPRLRKLLHLLTEAQIKRFIDDKTENQNLLRALQSPRAWKVILQDRGKNANEIRVVIFNRRAYASVSKRGESVFEIDPSLAKTLMLTSSLQ